MAWSNAEKERVAKLEREVKTLHEENGTLKNGLKAAVNEIQSLHKENNDLRTHINLLNYQNDSLGQYGRKESLRVQKAPEAVGETEDAEAIVLESANFVLSQIKSDDMFSEFKDFKVTHVQWVQGFQSDSEWSAKMSPSRGQRKGHKEEETKANNSQI